MMNATEMKNAARAMTCDLFTDVFQSNDAIQFGDASWAIAQTVDGKKIWTAIEIKTKAYNATKISPAFDPEVAARAWQEEKAMKANRKADKEREKAAKLAAKKVKEEEKVE